MCKISEISKTIRSVNTISFKNNCFLGENTDTYGFAEDLYRNNIFIKNKKVVVLGAGGSASSVILLY